MKELDLQYNEIRKMRDILIEEMREEGVLVAGVEMLKLVEMRLQTLFMSGVTLQRLQGEKKNFKL